MTDCLFCRIVAGEIPANKVYEDSQLIGFWDIAPQAPVHVLLIPKQHISSLYHMDDSNQGLIQAMIVAAPVLAKQLGLNDGFRLIANTGEACGQTVHHVHFHILGSFTDSGDTGFPA
ncbi:histidine triad nucleotide-binding protein [Reinekea sp.]|jgi:histidine triad (HIT) family protein|uniref:histidine triad nucleotide-binding protein n=1 Tax=Reinekea sp. TaxID=1970455 RepID=UPI002A82A507|nr:histidine triad nucleotide-binding protein [Reinekea sp.]